VPNTVVERAEVDWGRRRPHEVGFHGGRAFNTIFERSRAVCICRKIATFWLRMLLVERGEIFGLLVISTSGRGRPHPWTASAGGVERRLQSRAGVVDAGIVDGGADKMHLDRRMAMANITATLPPFARRNLAARRRLRLKINVLFIMTSPEK